jgi:hypothetical protein
MMDEDNPYSEPQGANLVNKKDENSEFNLRLRMRESYSYK